MLRLDQIRLYLINQKTIVKSVLALIFDFLIYILVFSIFNKQFSEGLVGQSLNDSINIQNEFYYYSLFCLLNTFFLIKNGYYNNKIKFVNVETLYSSASTSFLLLILCCLIFTLNNTYFSFFLFISILNVILIMFSMRAFLKSLLYKESLKEKDKVLIYGAGSAGVQLFDSIVLGNKYKIIGFLDDSKSKIGRKIGNTQVYNSEDFELLINANGVNMVFIAIPSISFEYRKKILKKLLSKKLNIRIKILPSTDTLINKNINFNLMKDISIEDIIGRKKIPPIAKLLKKNIKDKTVLITGAAGTIGSELCKKILDNKPKKVIVTDCSEIGLFNLIEDLKKYDEDIYFLLGDLKDKIFVNNFLKTHTDIDVAYHVAAYKHVNILEKNQFPGFYNNVIIIRNLIESLISNTKIKQFVNVSTDKAVAPTTIMGLSKFLCELIVNEYSKKSNIEFSIVRFGNVLKSSGSVLTIFDNQIKNQQPITVTHKKVKRFFMSVEEAVSLIIQSSALKGENRRFILDMGEQLSIYEIAKKMIALNGFSLKNKSNPNGDIEIKITGLKKGEKLEEELFSLSGKLLQTEHPMISKINEDLPRLNLESFFENLRENYSKNNVDFLFQLMIKSKNNDFEYLS